MALTRLLALLCTLFAVAMGSAPSAPPTTPGTTTLGIASAGGPSAPPSGPVEIEEMEISSSAPSTPPAADDDDDDDEDVEVAQKGAAGGKYARVKTDKAKLTPKNAISRADLVSGEKAEGGQEGSSTTKTPSESSSSSGVPMVAVYAIIGGSAAALMGLIGAALLWRHSSRPQQGVKSVSQIAVRAVTETSTADATTA